MENQLIAKDVTDLSPLYQEAMELHHQIMANGIMAALALVDLCKNLKLMRDRRAYEHLGYDTFDDYVEQMANMKRRQAYNYISTYERLGPEFLQSNAQLGITKLELLSQLPESTRESVIAQDDFNEKSAREIKELVDELTKAKEQLTFLEAEKEDVATALHETGENDNKRIDALCDRIKQLEAEKIKAEQVIKAQPQINQADIEAKVRKDVETEMNKKIDAVKQQVVTARNEGIESGREAVRNSLQAVEKEKAAAITRAQDLERQLKVAGNSETVIINHLFGELQTVIIKLATSIEKVNAGGDSESARKFKGAICKYLTLAKNQFSEEEPEK